MSRARSLLVLALPVALAAATATALTHPAQAQEAPGERARILAVVDSALAAINRDDMIAFTDLMIEETVLVRVREDSAGALYAARTRAAERARHTGMVVTERGFRPEVRVSGPLAVVWLPYDLYLDGRWSHCGVDVFTVIRVEGRWKIASLAWSVEQPPACARHPDGPPRRLPG